MIGGCWECSGLREAFVTLQCSLEVSLKNTFRSVCRHCWHAVFLPGTSQVRGILKASEVTAQAGALHDNVRTAVLTLSVNAA